MEFYDCPNGSLNGTGENVGAYRKNDSLIDCGENVKLKWKGFSNSQVQ